MISLVLPTFNPGPAIEQTCRSVRQFLTARAARGSEWEAIFVLDGCTDDTADRLARQEADLADGIRTVSYRHNRGKGYAVRTGLLAARGAIRIFTDVDLAYPFEDVLRVAAVIESGAAVVIGSRAHPESQVQLPADLLGYAYRRALQGRLFGTLARLLLPIANHDTQAGLKGMTAAVAEALLPHLTCDGFGFDCELLTACARGHPSGGSSRKRTLRYGRQHHRRAGGTQDGAGVVADPQDLADEIGRGRPQDPDAADRSRRRASAGRGLTKK